MAIYIINHLLNSIVAVLFQSRVAVRLLVYSIHCTLCAVHWFHDNSWAKGFWHHFLFKKKEKEKQIAVSASCATRGSEMWNAKGNMRERESERVIS